MKKVKNIFAVSFIAMMAVSVANAKVVTQTNIVGTNGVSVNVPTSGTNAGKVVVSSNADSELSSTSTNPVQNKVVNTALAGKQATISDLATIRSNATAGKGAADTIATYGDVVTHDASDFATSAQGGKADSALQAADITTGSSTMANGTISVKGTAVAVKGLGSAAYTASTAYATSAQGGKADTALQSVTANNGDGVVTGIAKSGTSITMTKAKVTESDLADAVVAKLGAGDSALQKADIATGSTNGTISVDGDDVAVKGLGSAAYTASTAYATSAQGTKADSALQAADITTGSSTMANGTISVKGTAVAVKGLGSAAYTASTAYATSAQGGKADTALQSVTANNGDGVVTGIAKSGTSITMTKAKVTESDLADAVVAKLGAGDSALQKADIATGSTNGTISVDGDDVAVKGLGSAAYTASTAYATAAQGALAASALQPTAASGTTGTKLVEYNATTGLVTGGEAAGALAKKSTISNADVASDAAITGTKVVAAASNARGTVQLASGSANTTAENVSNKVKATTNITEEQKESTDLYPSMATTQAMIDSSKGTLTAQISGKQPKSTDNYQMGKSGGGWQTMTDQQQNMLNGKIPVGSETATTNTTYASIWVE